MEKVTLSNFYLGYCYENVNIWDSVSYRKKKKTKRCKQEDRMLDFSVKAALCWATVFKMPHNRFPFFLILNCCQALQHLVMKPNVLTLKT